MCVGKFRQFLVNDAKSVRLSREERRTIVRFTLSNKNTFPGFAIRKDEGFTGARTTVGCREMVPFDSVDITGQSLSSRKPPGWRI